MQLQKFILQRVIINFKFLNFYVFHFAQFFMASSPDLRELWSQRGCDLTRLRSPPFINQILRIAQNIEKSLRN
jgi:hypothetical protein